MKMTPLTISEIQIIPVKPRDGLLAFTSFILNGCLYVGDVGLHARPDGSGYRLVYPARVLNNGKLVSAVHPIDRTTGDEIERAVVQAYETLIRKCAEKSHVNLATSKI